MTDRGSYNVTILNKTKTKEKEIGNKKRNKKEKKRKKNEKCNYNNITFGLYSKKDMN